MPLLSPDRAHLDTTTTPAADSLSPRRRSGERVRERGFKRARQFDGTSPSPPALSPLVPRREREQETSAMVAVSRCTRCACSLLTALVIISHPSILNPSNLSSEHASLAENDPSSGAGASACVRTLRS